MKHALAHAERFNPARIEGTTRRGFLAGLSGTILVSAFGLPSMELSGGGPKPNSSAKESKHLIHVVDDQDDLTELYRIVLEEAGYKVVTFTDRAEALTSFLVANPRPALLITDYDGYPISAGQLMRCCRAVQPALKVLMVSGYPECLLGPLSGKPDRFMEKPFAIESLLEGVRSLIGHSQKQVHAIFPARFSNPWRMTQ